MVERLVELRVLELCIVVERVLVVRFVVVRLVVERFVDLRVVEFRLLDELALGARPVPHPLERGGRFEHGTQLVLQEDEPDRL